MDITEENAKLKIEIDKLKEELRLTKEHLQRYTNPRRYKEYYDANKETINEKKRSKRKQCV